MMAADQRTPAPLALIVLTHPVNALGSGAAVVIGGIVTGWFHDLPVAAGPLLGAAAGTALIAAGGFVINDLCDIEIDRVNRPDRPLPAGTVRMPAARLIYAVLTAAGVLCAFSAGPAAGLVASAVALALFIYSAALKRRYLLGHTIIAGLGALLLPFGGLAVGSLFPTLYSIPIVLCAFFAREVLKTVPDYAGDRAAGVDNVATRHSPQRALRLGAGALLAAALLLPLVRLLWPLNGWFLLAVFAGVWPPVLLALRRARVETAAGLVRVSKLVFLLAALALLIGSVPA